MKISTKGRYAVRAMTDLAYHSKKLPISLSHISVRQDISLHYLEQLFVKLRRAGLVKSVRGPGGGYLLSREAKKINLKDVLLAVDEEIYPVECIRANGRKKNPCERLDDCVTRLIWKRLGDEIFKTLESITIQELCEEKEKIERGKRVKHNFVVNI